MMLVASVYSCVLVVTAFGSRGVWAAAIQSGDGQLPFPAPGMAFPPTNFTILEQKFNSSDASLSLTFSFHEPFPQGTPCTYFFDVFSVKSGQDAGRLKVSSNDIRRSFPLIGLRFSTAYQVKGYTKCPKLPLSDSRSENMAQFTTVSCLEATSWNLNLCVPPAPRQLTAVILNQNPPNNKNISVLVHWQTPDTVFNRTGLPAVAPGIFSYKISWFDIYIVTRPQTVFTDGGREIVLSGLQSGWKYKIQVSSALTAKKSSLGYGEAALIELDIPVYPDLPPPATVVPAVISTSTIYPAPDIPSPTAPTGPCPIGPLWHVSLAVGLGVSLLVVALIAIAVSFCVYRRRLKMARTRAHSASLPSVIQTLIPREKQISVEQLPAVQRNQLDNLIYLNCVDVPQIDLVPPYHGAVPASSMRRLAELDRGAFGIVHKAVLPIPGQADLVTVALKSVQANASPEERRALMDEIQIMKQIPHHHNVVRMVGHLVSPSPTEQSYLLLEFCENGSLKAYLTQHKSALTAAPPGTSQRLLLNFASQIADGMAHLARCHIVHRDLAARNVLLTRDLQVKVADFGLSRAVPDYYRQMRPGKVPWKWYAPESLTAEGGTFHSSKSDVWSFGMVLYEIFSLGRAPWAHIDRLDQLERQLEQGVRMARPTGCPETVYRIMEQCWQYLPANRPDFPQLSARLQSVHVPNSDETYVYFSAVGQASSSSSSNMSDDSAMGGSHSS